MNIFKGEYKTGYRYTGQDGMTHGGYIKRKLKHEITADVIPPRFIKQRIYIMRRHD